MNRSELLKKGAESGKAASSLAVQAAKSQQALEAANLIQDPAERAKKIKEIESGLRASQADAVKAIGGQFLKGDDRKRFDTALETSKLLRERILNHPDDFLPSWEDLTRDPTDQGRTPLQMLQSGFGDLGGIAKAAGLEKEFNALNAGLQAADLLDRYGLGDGAFSDVFGTKKQLDDLAKQLEKGDISSLGLAQAGIGLANLQAGLGMLSALGGVFGFGKDIAKVQKAVSALQGLQKAFSGDIAGGIDGILALDGLLFDLPPEAKEALSKAKELVNGLKKMGPMKPLTPSGSGVYVEGKQIAAFGLSGTMHGMPLMPGPGSANVTAYSMAVWRTNSDKHVCTLPGPGGAPHMPPPGGVVPVGATKTFANGLLIARHDDSTLEANGGGLVKVIPLPEAMAIAIKRAQEEAEKKRKAEEKKKAEKAAKARADKQAEQKALRESDELRETLEREKQLLEHEKAELLKLYKDDQARLDKEIARLKGKVDEIDKALDTLKESAKGAIVGGGVGLVFGGPAGMVGGAISGAAKPFVTEGMQEVLPEKYQYLAPYVGDVAGIGASAVKAGLTTGTQAYYDYLDEVARNSDYLAAITHAMQSGAASQAAGKAAIQAALDKAAEKTVQTATGKAIKKTL